VEGIVQKWGNSNAIRLPKPLLQSVNINENDSVLLTTSGENIIISKLEKGIKHITLEQRLADAGVALDYKIDSPELDSSSVGDEVFW
jgi:antitoxin MazE